MCDPGTIAGLVLTAAGTALQMSAQQKAQSEMKKARLAEFGRQEDMRQKGQVKLDETSGEFNRDQLDQSAAAQEADLSGQYRASTENIVQTAALPGGEGASSAPAIVDATKKAALEKTLGSLNQSAAARGKLNGFGRTLWDKGFGISDTAGEIGLVNDARRGSLGVLDFELQSAASKAQSPLGDILVGVGGSIGSGSLGSFGGGAKGGVTAVIPTPKPNPLRATSWGL
jgi:hypothetical protein